MLTLALVVALHASAGAAERRAGAFAFQAGAPVRPRTADSLLARAESLIVTHQLSAARRLAEHLQDVHPDDPRVLTLLGRVMLEWPVHGRFQAESLLARAAQLDPTNPEPLYYLGKVGLALSGDDGEQVARRGLVPLLALAPEYRDGWALWHKLYRGERERHVAIEALSRHAGTWNADFWRGQLLVELSEHAAAAALLEDVVRRRPTDPAPRAWLARTLFEAGHDAAGAAAYQAALDRAEEDTAQVLWKQLRGIASPEERRVYDTTPASGRAAFYRLFWSRRTPDLRAQVNGRYAEHFRRVAEAEHMFALLHPNSRYFHSKLFRTLAGGIGSYPGPTGDPLEGAQAHAEAAQCTARLPSIRDDAAQAGVGPRIETGGDDNAPNLEDGLSDQGRIYLRHGRPTYRFVGSRGDETWCYFRSDGSQLRVSFVRRTGGYGVSGDMVVTPLVHGEAEAAEYLLATDATDTPDDLAFAFWSAGFRADDRNYTELLVVPDSVNAVAVLVNAEGHEVARDTASGRPLRLVAIPGRYLLLIDAGRDGHRGRHRGTVTLADYSGEEPAVSSILIAAGAAAPTRDSLTALAPHGLALPVDQPLRVYAELYNMGRRDGTSRYLAQYQFERLDQPLIGRRREPVSTIGFEREAPFAPRLVESLVVDPGRLPKGRYRLHLEVTDRIRGTRAASATIVFTLR